MSQIERCNKFIENGNRFYHHMIHHFDDLINQLETIDYFYIRYTTHKTFGYYQKIDDEYCQIIQKEIIPWLIMEHKSGQLLNKDLWRPYQDIMDFTTMYYGYRKLFLFKNKYYLQLSLNEDVLEVSNGKHEWCITFECALYGWKEIDIPHIQPDNNVILDDDMMIPNREWHRNKLINK
jgi:hypothetical protein